MIERRIINILVVEDNLGDFVLMREFLQSKDLQSSVSHVRSLGEMIAKLEEQQYDVILLDLGLPDSFGLDTLKELRKINNSSAVIVLTGLNDHETALDSLKLGAQDYLPKNGLTADYVLRSIRYGIERKRFEQELVEAKLCAEESDRLKSAFLANMSHEIRTPINGILGFSELLADESLGSEKRNQFINIINNSGRHLLAVIDDIIDIAKIDSNQLYISNVGFNLNQLLDDLLLLYENEKIVRKKPDIKITLDKYLADNDCNIITDDIRLGQVLRNLISNSLKFTEKGHIRFGYTCNGKELSFYVEDTGKGILESKQSFVFERFRQEDDSYTRTFGGTGLGLSISKGLVELLGGNMWFVSEENVGSTFFFTIPFVSLKNKNELVKNKSIDK